MAKRAPRTLTDDELEGLLAQVKMRSVTGTRNKGALKVMAYGGLRVSEVVALRTQDVRLEDGKMRLEVRDGKGGRDRTVPLPDHAKDTVMAWQERRRELGIGNGHLFCTVSSGRAVRAASSEAGLVAGETVTAELTPGSPLGVRYLQAIVPKLAARAGIEGRVTCHHLRHTAGTRMLRACGDVRRVQELLGHASILTTQQYLHVTADEVAEAIDLVPDVERRDEAQPTSEADTLAAQVADLQAQLAALAAQLGEEV